MRDHREEVCARLRRGLGRIGSRVGVRALLGVGGRRLAEESMLGDPMAAAMRRRCQDASTNELWTAIEACEDEGEVAVVCVLGIEGLGCREKVPPEGLEPSTR